MTTAPKRGPGRPSVPEQDRKRPVAIYRDTDEYAALLSEAATALDVQPAVLVRMLVRRGLDLPCSTKAVHHIDGDTTNDSPDNVVAVPVRQDV